MEVTRTEREDEKQKKEGEGGRLENTVMASTSWGEEIVVVTVLVFPL